MDPELSARLDRIEALLAALLQQRDDPTGGRLNETDKGILAAMWQAAPPQARQRSSKADVAEQWCKIPRNQRPDMETVVKAVAAWKQCDEWLRDGGQFIKGLHRLVKARFWESAPERNSRVGQGFATPKRQEYTPQPGGMDPQEAADFLKQLMEQ